MKRVVIFLGLALVLVSGCKRSGLDIDSEPRALSVESISLVESAEWGTKSALQDTTVVDLGDSVMMTCDLGFIGDEALTKGTPMESASNISTFKIKVFNTGASNWSTSSTVTADVTATKSGSSFNCSPSYNWKSETDKVTLMSYAPVAGGTTGLSEYNNYTIQYIVPTDVANHPDFCATNAETNLVNDDGTKHLRTFNMSHKLAAVGFALNGWNVKITKVEITGVCFYGRYDMNTGAWTQVETLGSRTGGVNGATVNNSYSSNKTWTNATSNNGYMMMIPQTLSANSKAIITYTATGGTATSGTITAPLNGLTGGKWTAGQKVTYNIQLKMAPALTTTELTMPGGAGYTTTQPLAFGTKDPKDEYTFTWNADWLFIHNGDAKVNNTDYGAKSNWSTVSGFSKSLWFFSKTDNTSTSVRTATVTMTGKRTGTKTFVVKQEAAPAGVKVGNIYWAYGNLVADGANKCKIGAPTDCGLYFHFGSLVGWSGGSNGDGTGKGQPGLSQRVKPSGYSGSGGWPAGHYTAGSSGSVPTTANTSTGVGDPCRYYLGGKWRLPTKDEYVALGNTGYSFGSGGGNFASNQLFIPASGFRNYKNGSFSYVGINGYYWSGSVYNSERGSIISLSSSGYDSQSTSHRSVGTPVRCVTE